MKNFIKKYLLESLVLLAQLLAYYIGPLFAGPTDAMAMVLLIVLETLLISFAAGLLVRRRIKFFYPFAAAILFLPSVPLYYKEPSALVHAWWYFILSAAGILVGTGLSAAVRAIGRKIKRKSRPSLAEEDKKTDL